MAWGDLASSERRARLVKNDIFVGNLLLNSIFEMKTSPTMTMMKNFEIIDLFKILFTGGGDRYLFGRDNYYIFLKWSIPFPTYFFLFSDSVKIARDWI